MTYSADLTPDLLSCQVQILLVSHDRCHSIGRNEFFLFLCQAQAHEAILEKSLLDQRPASVNAPIAMQISEYYQMAHLNLMKPGINSIVSKRFRVNLHSMINPFVSIVSKDCIASIPGSNLTYC